MTREKRLGRGLEALLGRSPTPAGAAIPARSGGPTVPPTDAEGPYGGAFEEPYSGPPSLRADLRPPPPGPVRPELATQTTAPHGTRRVEVGRIDSNPFQPRRQFDPAELTSLADSLRDHGLLQPIVVRQKADRYQLIAGERRLRAATQAGWTHVPVHIVEADDRQVAELAIVENLHRKDLSPLEKAASFQSYLEQYGCTQEELANRLDLDRSTIANLIRLMELPEPVQESLRHGHITQGHARALLTLGDEHEQVKFCQKIRDEGLSVRQTETLVQETVERADASPIGLVGRDGKKFRPKRVASEHVAALEQELRAALGTKVAITHNARGRGKLVIHFGSHEEFQRLRDYLCGPEQDRVQGRAG